MTSVLHFNLLDFSGLRLEILINNDVLLPYFAANIE